MSRYDQPNEWWLPASFRPKMFVLTNCKGLEVHDITFSEAPEWGLHMIGCEHVLVDNLKIRNLLDVPTATASIPTIAATSKSATATSSAATMPSSSKPRDKPPTMDPRPTSTSTTA